MDVRKRIHSLFENEVFPTLSASIQDCYQEDVTAGTFAIEERDYMTAIEALDKALSKPDKDRLTSTEQLYIERRAYATKYGFTSGMAYGYAQCLASPLSESYDFNHSICKGLLEIPGMNRHYRFHEACEAGLANLKIFEDTLSEELNEHIISISCAWDQRIYSAARDAFYIGYQTAYSFMEQLSPTISIHNIAHILELEFNLGYTDAYYRREAHR